MDPNLTRQKHHRQFPTEALPSRFIALQGTVFSPDHIYFAFLRSFHFP